MAEEERPTEASVYALWTLQNVWYNKASKYLPKFDLKFAPAYENGDNDKKTEDSEVINEGISYNEDRVIADEDISNSDYRDDEEIRKNVWSDVDDELYIANLIQLRTSNEVNRVKRDNSDSSVSEFREEVVNSDKLDKYEMWDLEPTDLKECDCLGPPPEFLLPPPPRPPFLQSDYYCGDDPIPDLETCDTEPVSKTYYLI